MYYIQTEQSFDAAHFLADHPGKCKNIHGHRWRVLLEVESDDLQPDGPGRGMVTDFDHIKTDLKSMTDLLDHKFLVEKGTLQDDFIAAFKAAGFEGVFLPFRTTAENFARFFYDELTKKGHSVHKVTVYETPNNCATYQR